ncbi:putative AlkP superfamily pyrophosphatase or phosphodiesterase [Lysinibacillus composti]|uniref:Alkaline phosphatase family protein n=1 Tax=Lysinibacillus composti TaxID=720633 RepID=A0A3N9UGD4_9BACI|nr:alkaline phosphatase family protein [Lysinibacillus composti]MBM7608152.1 putative AlkP superfamily pyrophosphatase or phosphodiesterase [Lysinibacillus composti]RQW75219.1 alkaline phosphatase family protein [Lysinibacillus composti]
MKLNKVLLITITIMIVVLILVFSFSLSPTREIAPTGDVPTDKPIIFITVDSLMSEPLQKAIDQEKAPALSFLINHGQFHRDMISSYPTMSVAIDSTVLTGTYPDQHKIPGLIWFNKNESRIISYGSGFREIWNNGVKNVTHDSIIRLNKEHLSQNVETIHEALSKKNLASASINGLIFRGNTEQDLNVPKLVSFTGLLPKSLQMNGPTILSLGALSQYNPKNDFHKFIWKRMGVNNQFTVNELKYLIEKNNLPSFTFAYLPDEDAELHKNGPGDIKAIERTDQSIQQLLNSYPSWEDAIDQAIWIIFGDSAQSSVKDNKKTALINLNKLLEDYSFWDTDKPNGQIAIAINERMAYINLIDENIDPLNIVKNLQTDNRIGFIAWKNDGINYVLSPESNEPFTFSVNGPITDQYQQTWTIDGDPSILDLTIQEGTISYGDYPDALARLHGALNSHEGPFIIVDAKPQYEFIEEHSHDHAGGGAHGSLHRIDSLVPLIITGTNQKPKYNRLVDFKQWIIDLTE